MVINQRRIGYDISMSIQASRIKARVQKQNIPAFALAHRLYIYLLYPKNSLDVAGSLYRAFCVAVPRLFLYNANKIFIVTAHCKDKVKG